MRDLFSNFKLIKYIAVRESTSQENRSGRGVLCVTLRGHLEPGMASIQRGTRYTTVFMLSHERGSTLQRCY